MRNYCKRHNRHKMADSEVVEEELDSAQDSQGYRSIKKPNTTSKVWMHFGLNCDKDGTPIPTEIDKPVCRHCHN